MDLKQLQYFVTCAQTGSVSEAAKILYSTQQCQQGGKALEDSLGMQLFERLPRGIRLTPQGSQVYRYACKIVGEVTKLEAMADHGMTKWLRISANPSSCSPLILWIFIMRIMTEIIIFRFTRQEFGQ